MTNTLTRLIIKGGVLSPGELKLICQTAEDLGLKYISFGSRQDILFPDKINDRKINSIENFQIVDPVKDTAENIMSSYVLSLIHI